MKFTNFRLTEIIRVGNPFFPKFRATVDVTTGFFRKKTQTMDIFKDYKQPWIYVATGETVSYRVEYLERAYTAQRGKNLEDCL